MAQLPWHEANHRLTGNLRVRIGWFGCIILQVQEQYQIVRGCPPNPEVGSTPIRWRDATITDIQSISPMRLHMKE